METKPNESIIKRTSYPIRAMDNPRALIEHKGNALEKNLGGNTNKEKVILPTAKVKKAS